MKYQPLKFSLNNKQHSEIVQETLFQMGFAWRGGPEQDYEHSDKPYLYVNEGGYLAYGRDPKKFVRQQGREIDVSWMDPEVNKTVEYNGKTYSKTAFEEAIAELEVLSEDV